jgi:hypothetical protein
MLYNRPFRKDARALELLQDIGAASGMHFETSSFSEEVLGKIKSIPADFAKESAHTAIPWEQMQGQTADAGYYKRAKNAFQNVDGIIDAEAVRLISKTDAGGETFDSFANRYVLHFEKNQIPQGKWSLTAYDAAGFLMKNPLNRYALTYNGVKKKADGSVDIYIQKNQPSKDKTVNWLPVSQKSFALVFKNYPSDKPFDAAALPAVKKAKK